MVRNIGHALGIILFGIAMLAPAFFMSPALAQRLDSLDRGEADSQDPDQLEQVVVSGTMKEVSKLESPVPVEVYTQAFFKSNPTPSIFDALQHINGVRPQLNCNICNTGDIHINGLEGPYTMVMIDGMPIVSGLSTVYGLSGIPQALIDRVEIVKGPASTLYGSEAVAGLINIITKDPQDVPLFSAEVFGTSWAEANADMSARFAVGHKAHALAGVNYFNYSQPYDDNRDGFTDVTLQHRVSVFNKWRFDRPDNRAMSFAARYVYEDRWGGEMDWGRVHRGGDALYGESIYTSRWELFGNYQLPLKEHLLFRFSANGHDQNSMYGTSPYVASQYIGFGQLTWSKPLSGHDLLAGLSYRYTWYNDNTPATAAYDNPEKDQPAEISLPGIFLQDEIALGYQNKLLLGLRYDYHSVHGNILTPRLNYKWNSGNKNTIVRLSLGSGYRVAHIFTEDHAALTGARQVVFTENLDPERSWNGNLNLQQKFYAGHHTFIGLDASVFYTHFNNKIIADYETDVNKIIYSNLRGYAVSKGVSLNLDFDLHDKLKVLLGGTLMDVYSVENEERSRQLLTERFAGVWNIAYSFPGVNKFRIDYTGNLYGPMRLPLISESDPRKPDSPWWSIQNIQLTASLGSHWEIYGGVKNLLNWRPGKGNPFLIARAHDPFDKQVEFDGSGQAVVTPQNPYGLTFDPNYMYGPNQGIRGFLGVRFTYGSISNR